MVLWHPVPGGGSRGPGSGRCDAGVPIHFHPLPKGWVTTQFGAGGPAAGLGLALENALDRRGAPGPAMSRVSMAPRWSRISGPPDSQTGSVL